MPLAPWLAVDARMASWSRVTAGTVALFAIVLAFLAGRVRSGGDPTQAKASTRAPVVTTQALPAEEPAPEPLTTRQS
jgi:hypothetical protein